MNRASLLASLLSSLVLLAGCVTSQPRVAELSNEELKTRLEGSSVIVRPVVSPAFQHCFQYRGQ